MPEVASTSEEARKQVERVMVPSSTALLMLLQTFVPVLVIDATSLAIRKGFVSFGNLNKLLMNGVITSKDMLVVNGLGERMKYEITYGFLSG